MGCGEEMRFIKARTVNGETPGAKAVEAEMDAISKTFTIINQMGLHARPAALLVQSVQHLDCEVAIEKDGTRVDGKSIMGVMMLAAECGSEIHVTSRGPDAIRAIEEIERVVNTKFGEE